MKTFRELISWELEQDKKGGRSLHISAEDHSGKLGSCVLRKLRHLSATAASQATAAGPSLTPFA